MKLMLCGSISSEYIPLPKISHSQSWDNTTLLLLHTYDKMDHILKLKIKNVKVDQLYTLFVLVIQLFFLVCKIGVFEVV